MSSHPEYYRVFKLKFKLSVQDPDITGIRFHHIIFVESGGPRDTFAGYKFHVMGDITSGMEYQSIPYHNPVKSDTEHTTEFLGYTAAKTFPTEWDKLLQTLPPPGKQKAFNSKTMKTEPFKTLEPPNLPTFYQPGEPRRRLRKCTEWTEEQALPALRASGLIVPNPPASAPSSAPRVPSAAAGDNRSTQGSNTRSSSTSSTRSQLNRASGSSTATKVTGSRPGSRSGTGY